MCFAPSAASPCSARWRPSQRCERVGNNTELGICYPAVLEINKFPFRFQFFPMILQINYPYYGSQKHIFEPKLHRKKAILCLAMLKCLQACNTDLKSFRDFPWHISYQLVFAFEVNTQKKKSISYFALSGLFRRWKQMCSAHFHGRQVHSAVVHT